MALGRKYPFFRKIGDLIRSLPPQLIFGADETMINLNKAHNSVIDSSIAFSIEEMDDRISHINVMLSQSVAGSTVLPFVILPQLQHAPDNRLDII
jgi:hypothetical protein